MILQAIEDSGIQSGLSVKPTQIGLALDENLCEENMVEILTLAKKLNNFVRIDMEDSACVDATMRVYWNLRRKHGFDNVGMVIQSYLYRSDEDTRALLEATSEPDAENAITFKEVPPGEPPSLINPPTGCRFHPRCPDFIDGVCDEKEPVDFGPRDNHLVACWLYE